MFLFNLGIEHESDTTGQRFVGQAEYATPAVMKDWQKAFEKEISEESKFIEVNKANFKGKLEDLKHALASRDWHSVSSVIHNGSSALKLLDEIQQEHEIKWFDYRPTSAMYTLGISVFAIVRCYEDNWTEPLLRALKDKDIRPELRDCINSWLTNTDRVKLNGAVRERNLGLVVELMEYYSKNKSTRGDLLFMEAVSACYRNSWHEPLENFLSLKQPEKTQKKRFNELDFTSHVQYYLNKMGPIIERDKETFMHQNKTNTKPEIKKTGKETSKIGT